MQRTTYTTRINELRNTDATYQTFDGKALPDKPRDRDSTDSKNQEPLSPLTDEDDRVYISTSTTAHGGRDRPHVPASRYAPAKSLLQLSPRRQSLQPSAFADSRTKPLLNRAHTIEQQPSGRLQPPDRIVERSMTIEAPMSRPYMPPPLSPRRPLSPVPPPKDDPQSSVLPTLVAEPGAGYHTRQDTVESTSWLDTIDESGGSSSSVHSRSSSIGLRRKHIRAASGATEADFDAALDAAVEAAYDDGFVPADDEDGNDSIQLQNEHQHQQALEHDLLSDVRKNVEMAKENVREVEREAAVASAKGREKQRLQDPSRGRDSLELDYGDDEAEEEERMLDELSRDYNMGEGDYDVQTKSALPRQSGSSGFSGRTWGSSIGSNPTSAGTSLSTVAELPSLITQLQSKGLPPPMHPPPLGALPPPPQTAPGTAIPPSGSITRPSSLITSPGVRDRRLSGLKVKQLKIETNTKSPAAPETESPKLQPTSEPPVMPTQSLPEPPGSAVAAPHSEETLPNLALKLSISSINQTASRKGSSPLPTPSPAEGTPSTIPATPALTKVTSADSFDSIPSIPDSPGRFNVKDRTGSKGIKKNFSSSSLKNKILSVSTTDPSEAVPNPTESGLSGSKQWRVPSTAVPVMPTPTSSSFLIDGLSTEGIHLFGSDIHSPTTPGSPNPLVANAPLPLEPCPESSLLRPFWFLRCIYQTIAHPRGGYISNKLFVPRDIWKVKTTKLKSVDEKISSCDLLTATLLKLAKVDTFDVDAIFNEMKFLETVMDQVRLSLSKRLGGEVGTVGAPWLSKGGGSLDDMHSTSDTLNPRSTNLSTKSYLSSWKKNFKSKNSTGPGYTAAAAIQQSRDGSKETPALKSLPMTNKANPRFARRDLSQVQYGGPNANYMAALAKLCDAVQILGMF